MNEDNLPMPPQTPPNPIQPVPPVTPVPVAPVSFPSPTVPPVVPPPPGFPPPAATGNITTSPPSRFDPKKLGIILGVVALVVALALLVVFVVLPRIRGGGETTITWWGLWEDESVVRPLIDEYQQANPNIKIVYTKQSAQDYRERLTNSLAKGQGPDVFRFHNTWVPMFKNELDVLPSTVMTAAEFSSTFYPVAASDLTSGTGFVGIPLEYDGLALFVNEDMFAEAGKNIPTTWDDLRIAARDLTRKTEEGIIERAGVALGRIENVDHWQEILALMMLQNGANLSKPDSTLAEDAVVFYTVFAKTDKVWDASLPPSTLAFANGKVAMYFGPSWRVFEIKAKNPNLKFKVVPVPQLPKDSPSERDITYASYWVEGVWTRSKSKSQAWKFLKFLSSKESLEKMYKNAATQRLFGEPYPRVDMAGLLAGDPFAAAFVTQAPSARSWYLADRTFDGPTGINSQMAKYFEDAVNSVNSGGSAGKALETLEAGVAQILTQHGLTKR